MLDGWWAQSRCLGCGDLFQFLVADGEQPSAEDLEFCRECIQDFGIMGVGDAEEVKMFFRDKTGQVGPEKKEPKNVTPAKPKVNPAAVLAGVRAQCDYKVGPVTEYTKAITYVCAKNGLFEVRDSELVRVIVRPKEVLGLGDETEMKEGIEWKLPKVPFLFLQQTISFFRGVEQRFKGSSEALIQVWWDRETQRHEIHVPDQQVSAGGVHHNSVMDEHNEGRLIHVMDIHSHGTGMSAFWSGTDNNDERKIYSERFFGVIGRISQPFPDMKWRMRTREGFVDLALPDVFDMSQHQQLSFTVTPDVFFRAMANPANVKDGFVQLMCPVDPFSDIEIPAEWYDRVKAFHYPSQSHGGHGWMGNWRGGNAHQRQFPAFIKGYVYIDGLEYEIDGDKRTPTGRKLLPAPTDKRLKA